MVRKENKNLIGRLSNYKFESAQKYLAGESEEVAEVVNALADTFANCGWIDGNIGVIVATCVDVILPCVVNASPSSQPGNEIALHIARRHAELNDIRSLWSSYEQNWENLGVLEDEYSRFKALISSKIAYLEKSIIDHEKLLPTS